MDTIQAAILDIKLRHLDSYNAARVALADQYDAAFTGNPRLQIPFRAGYGKHVFHQYTLTLNFEENAAAIRNGLKTFLAEQQIPAMIYYPVPCHRQEMFAAFGSGKSDLPVTDWLTDRVISLPMHSEMHDEQVGFITTKVLEYINNQ
jgi:dTDP-4-amino-4,6-dideoxygalactose transaminase